MEAKAKRAKWPLVAAVGAVGGAFLLGRAARPASDNAALPSPALIERSVTPRPTGTACGAASTVPPAQPSPQARAVVDQAISLVNAARWSGHWAVDDRAKLRELSRRLTSDQYDEVLRALVKALNVGELQADFDGPPM